MSVHYKAQDHPIGKIILAILEENKLDERVDLEDYVKGYIKTYSALYDDYCNEDRSNHIQAKELALNDVKNQILNENEDLLPGIN